MTQSSPTQLNGANSTGLFQDTIEGKVQKWVVLIECVGWVIFLNGPVNCSLRNGSPIGALGCGLLCYPGHDRLRLLRALREQHSHKCHQQGSVFIDAFRIISHSHQRGSVPISIFYFVET